MLYLNDFIDADWHTRYMTFMKVRASRNLTKVQVAVSLAKLMSFDMIRGDMFSSYG